MDVQKKSVTLKLLIFQPTLFIQTFFHVSASTIYSTSYEPFFFIHPVYSFQFVFGP